MRRWVTIGHDGHMRVMLKFEIDCDVDAAWRALHSPTVVSELYTPLMQLRPIDQLPTSWEPGAHGEVQMLAAGVIPVGRQLIRVSDHERTVRGQRVRIFHDSGIPLSGPLSTLTRWDHQMAVSEIPGRPDRTLWRDRLIIEGATAPLFWPAMWAAWQWRQARITALAPSWAYDPELDDAFDEEDALEAVGADSLAEDA